MPQEKRRRGAPKGNLNALKSGAHSRRFRAVIAALLIQPDTRSVLLTLNGPKRAQLDKDYLTRTLNEIAAIVKEHKLATSVVQKRTCQLKCRGGSPAGGGTPACPSRHPMPRPLGRGSVKTHLDP